MGDWQNEIVNESLPTPWSRRIAGMTLFLALSGFWLPEFLKKIGLSIAGTDTLSFRISVLSTVLFLGLFSILLLVLCAYKNLSSEHAAEIEKLKKSKPEMIISPEALSRFDSRSTQ